MIERIDPGKTMSRAVVFGDVIYFGGHVAGGKQPTIKEQTAALLARYDELFALHGTDKNHLLMVSIYLSDFSLKEEMNEVYNEWIEEGNAPARVCVQAGLAEGYLLEMTVVAAKKK